MDKDLRIGECKERVAQLESELQATKEYSKRYTSPANSKELYVFLQVFTLNYITKMI